MTTAQIKLGKHSIRNLHKTINGAAMSAEILDNITVINDDSINWLFGTMDFLSRGSRPHLAVQKGTDQQRKTDYINYYRAFAWEATQYQKNPKGFHQYITTLENHRRQRNQEIRLMFDRVARANKAADTVAKNATNALVATEFVATVASIMIPAAVVLGFIATDCAARHISCRNSVRRRYRSAHPCSYPVATELSKAAMDFHGFVLESDARRKFIEEETTKISVVATERALEKGIHVLKDGVSEGLEAFLEGMLWKNARLVSQNLFMLRLINNSAVFVQKHAELLNKVRILPRMGIVVCAAYELKEAFEKAEANWQR